MRRPRLPVLAAFAYGAAVFLPMLANSFYRDDFGWVERALAAGGDPARWLFLAKTDFRPLGSLSVVLNLALGGLQPAGYYAFNLALHLANVALLMALVRRISGGSQAAAAISGILFAGAVGNYGEAVCWICGRTGPIADCFVLAALVAHWDWLQRGRSRDRAWSLLSFGLSLLGKESAVMLLPLLLLLEWVHAGRQERASVTRVAARLAPHAALLAAYLVFQFGFWRRASLILGSGGEYQLGWHALRNLCEYLVRMFLPVSPTSTFMAPPGAIVPALRVLYAVLGVALPLALLALLAGRASRAVKFALAWIPVTLLPVVFFTYRTSARYLYEPSMGLAMAAGLAGSAWCLRAGAAMAPLFPA